MENQEEEKKIAGSEPDKADAVREMLDSFTDTPEISPLQMADIEKFNVSQEEINSDLKKGDEEQHQENS
jgi:hypothetical protein